MVWSFTAGLSVSILSSHSTHGVMGSGHSSLCLNNILLWVDHLPAAVDRVVIHVLLREYFPWASSWGDDIIHLEKLSDFPKQCSI